MTTILLTLLAGCCLGRAVHLVVEVERAETIAGARWRR